MRFLKVFMFGLAWCNTAIASPKACSLAGEYIQQQVDVDLFIVGQISALNGTQQEHIMNRILFYMSNAQKVKDAKLKALLDECR